MPAGHHLDRRAGVEGTHLSAYGYQQRPAFGYSSWVTSRGTAVPGSRPMRAVNSIPSGMFMCAGFCCELVIRHSVGVALNVFFAQLVISNFFAKPLHALPFHMQSKQLFSVAFQSSCDLLG